MTLLERMDRLVHATRIDRVIFMKMPPRSLRWTPLFVLVALVTGYVLMARAATYGHVRELVLAALLFYCGVVAAGFVRVFGPRMIGTERQPLDEREQIVKAQAYGISGAVLAALAWLGCFYMAGAEALRLWHPRGYDWVNLGFGLQAGAMLLPTWVASWLEPRAGAPGED